MGTRKIIIALSIIGLSSGALAEEAKLDPAYATNSGKLIPGFANMTIKPGATSKDTLSETMKFCNFLGEAINVFAYSEGAERYVTTTASIKLNPYDARKGPQCGDLTFTLPSGDTDITNPIVVKSFIAGTENQRKVAEFKVNHIMWSTKKLLGATTPIKALTIGGISMTNSKAWVFSPHSTHSSKLEVLEVGTEYESLNGGGLAPDHLICFMHAGVNAAPCNTDTIYKN